MIEGKKVPWGQLRTRREFTLFVQELERVLQDEREAYEMSTASEYRRGRVNVLRELLEDINGTSR